MDRSLTEKQQAFIENFSQTGNAKQTNKYYFKMEWVKKP